MISITASSTEEFTYVMQVSTATFGSLLDKNELDIKAKKAYNSNSVYFEFHCPIEIYLGHVSFNSASCSALEAGNVLLILSGTTIVDEEQVRVRLSITHENRIDVHFR